MHPSLNPFSDDYKLLIYFISTFFEQQLRFSSRKIESLRPGDRYGAIALNRHRAESSDSPNDQEIYNFYEFQLQLTLGPDKEQEERQFFADREIDIPGDRDIEYLSILMLQTQVSTELSNLFVTKKLELYLNKQQLGFTTEVKAIGDAMGEILQDPSKFRYLKINISFEIKTYHYLRVKADGSTEFV